MSATNLVFPVRVISVATRSKVTGCITSADGKKEPTFSPIGWFIELDLGFSFGPFADKPTDIEAGQAMELVLRPRK